MNRSDAQPKSRTTTSRPPSEIPTSSMGDVSFLILVFLLIAATFTATRGLDMTFPDEPEDAREIDPVESVRVDVLPGGDLEVDGRSMPLGDLLAYLEPKLAADPIKPVIVLPRPGTPYGRAVDVLDELRQGRQRLGLAEEIVIALPTRREIDRYWS